MKGYEAGSLFEDDDEDIFNGEYEEEEEEFDTVGGYNPFGAIQSIDREVRGGEEHGESEMVSLVRDESDAESNTSIRTSTTMVHSYSVPRNRLGIVMGVYIPCLLSIFGVIMFERMSWVLGEAGLLTAYLILFSGFCMVFFTALSISAIATNGKMKGGGAYFMVSRSLGPEFGGAIGLIFYSANVSGAALYLVGLVEGLHNTFPSMPSTYWWNVLYASIGLLILTVVCFLGASAFVKANFVIFGVMVVALVAALGSLLFEKENLKEGFTGLSKETFQKNLYPKFTSTRDPYSASSLLLPSLSSFFSLLKFSSFLLLGLVLLVLFFFFIIVPLCLPLSQRSWRRSDSKLPIDLCHLLSSSHRNNGRGQHVR
jgi:hypothetical protein